MSGDPDPTVPASSLEPGCYYLCGDESALLGSVFFDLAADGCLRAETVVVLAVGTPLSTVVAAFEDRLPGRPETLHVVAADADLGSTPEWVSTVSSPGDLTGLGMYTSDMLEDATGGARVCLDSVSALLAYSEFSDVFQFLHVLSNRVGAVDGVCVAGVDTAAVPDVSRETLLEVATGRVHVRNGDSPAVKVESRGDESEWRPLNC